MIIPMIVESVGIHTHRPTETTGMSARCAMVPGFHIAVAGRPGCIPSYVNIVVDVNAPVGALKEGDIFDMEFRQA
jgi:hypothetical protein